MAAPTSPTDFISHEYTAIQEEPSSIGIAENGDDFESRLSLNSLTHLDKDPYLPIDVYLSKRPAINKDQQITVYNIEKPSCSFCCRRSALEGYAKVRQKAINSARAACLFYRKDSRTTSSFLPLFQGALLLPNKQFAITTISPEYSLYWLYFEYSNGDNLPKASQILNIAKDILNALSELHSQGLIYENLSLETIGYKQLLDLSSISPIPDERDYYSPSSDLYQLGRALFRLYTNRTYIQKGLYISNKQDGDNENFTNLDDALNDAEKRQSSLCNHHCKILHDLISELLVPTEFPTAESALKILDPEDYKRSEPIFMVEDEEDYLEKAATFLKEEDVSQKGEAHHTTSDSGSASDDGSDESEDRVWAPNALRSPPPKPKEPIELREPFIYQKKDPKSSRCIIC